MPQGCDFWCDNKACSSHGETIVMHGAWPTKRIDEAIADAQAQGDIQRKEALEQRREAGRKVALFVYPADKNSSPAGYRIQFYCPACLIVEDKDCGRDPKETANLADNPTDCEKCGGKRFSLKSSIPTSIPCPTCHVAMKQFHWFTK